MWVQEMFFYVYVGDVQRAKAFYANAMGATVEFDSPTWASLLIAGVRMNLVEGDHEPSATGLHFIVENVALACAAVTSAGGDVAPAIETPHGVIAEAFDSEGNTFTLRQCRDIPSVAHAA